MKKTICTLAVVSLLATTALAATPYPVEVNEYMAGENMRLERVYELPAGEKMSDIPTADFTRDGYDYTLLDITQVELPSTEQQGHEEVVVTTSKTKVPEEVLATLEPTMEYTTPEGFTGELVLDPTTLVIEPAKYANSSRTVTATRNYPSLSSADVALVPKSVTENGVTMNLADVQWTQSNEFYTANAKYSGAVSSRYVSEYDVTVNYSGILAKEEDAGAVVTAIFSAQPIQKADQNVGDDTETSEAPEPTLVEANKSSSWMMFVVALAALLSLGSMVFAGTLYAKSKKKTY